MQVLAGLEQDGGLGHQRQRHMLGHQKRIGVKRPQRGHVDGTSAQARDDADAGFVEHFAEEDLARATR